MAKVVRIGDKQYERLKAMSQAHGVSMSQMISILVDKIQKVKGVEIIVSDENTSDVVEEGWRMMINQYPTVAEVERKDKERRE